MTSRTGPTDIGAEGPAQFGPRRESTPAQGSPHRPNPAGEEMTSQEGDNMHPPGAAVVALVFLSAALLAGVLLGGLLALLLR